MRLDLTAAKDFMETPGLRGRWAISVERTPARTVVVVVSGAPVSVISTEESEVGHVVEICQCGCRKTIGSAPWC